MFGRITLTPLLKPLLCLLMSLLMSCSTGGISHHRLAEGDSFPPDRETAFEPAPGDAGTLKILTLNIAHGRNQAANQLFLDRQDIEQNLRAVAALFRDIGADVIALQEADGPSRWSGNFDHIEFLAREAGYPWHYRANHAESWLFSYGTALLSRLPVDETLQHTFKPSPPTLNKGFLLGRVNWSENGSPGAVVPIDIVSVHLDYSRSSVRDGQIAELTEILKLRRNPMIIMGDFNSEWPAEDSVVRRFAENAGMSVYRQSADDLDTYNSKYRFDWILLSSELAFVSYSVLPDKVSDHKVVLAEVRLRKTAGAPSQQAD